MEEQIQQIKNLLTNYQPTTSTKELITQTAPVFLTGISGAGKDTIKQRMLETSQFYHIVSHTTRPPRENNGILEVNGVDYHFISLTQALTMLERQEFVEAKLVHDNIYGTSVAEFEQSLLLKKRPLTDIDVQGVAEYLKLSDKIVPIFVLPPSFEVWQARLRQRYSSEAEFNREWQKRAASAQLELRTSLNQSHYHWLINDNLELAIEQAMQLARGEMSTTDEAGQTVARDFLDRLSS